jgi:hypothetical protein
VARVLFKLDDLPDGLKKQAEAQLGNRGSICTAKQESSRAPALGKAQEVPQLRTPVYIRFTVYKTGDNWDADNREVKQIIDSIVSAGIIPDDTIRHVPQVFKKGVRVKTKAEERTVVEVIEL